jgi:hypothetical protein
MFEERKRGHFSRLARGPGLKRFVTLGMQRYFSPNFSTGSANFLNFAAESSCGRVRVILSVPVK